MCGSIPGPLAARCAGWTGRERSAASSPLSRSATTSCRRARTGGRMRPPGLAGSHRSGWGSLMKKGVLPRRARRYGRSPRGERAFAKVPFGNWKRLSVLSALGIEGILATMSVEAATDGDTFAAYLEQVLLPVLRERKPDAVLVMDNLRPHKTPEVQAVLDGSGFPYRFLPSYSPDLSPIEPGWAKVKSYLRRVAARTVEALQQALAPALDSITAHDAKGFFRHCGYACPN